MTTELDRYNLQKCSKAFSTNYLLFKEKYYKSKHIEVFNSLKHSDSMIYEQFLCYSEDQPYKLPYDRLITYQRFYNNSDLFITLIYPAIQYEHFAEYMFIAVDDYFEVNKIIDDKLESQHKKLQFNNKDGNIDYKSFIGLLNKYCGVPANNKVYAHRLIASINEDCKGLQVHHRNQEENCNAPANLVVLTKKAHNAVTQLEKQGASNLEKEKIIEEDREQRELNRIKPRERASKFDDEEFKFKASYLYYIQGLPPKQIKARFKRLSPSIETIYKTVAKYRLFKNYYQELKPLGNS